jgi:hypothetical protein
MAQWGILEESWNFVAKRIECCSAEVYSPKGAWDVGRGAWGGTGQDNEAREDAGAAEENGKENKK